MTDDDRPAFAEALWSLSRLFPRDVDAVLADVYFTALADLELEAVLEAMREHTRTGRFFPVPAELRVLAGGGMLLACEIYERLQRILRQSLLRLPDDLEPFDRLVIAALGGGMRLMEMPATLLRKLVDDRAAEWVEVARVRRIELPERRGSLQAHLALPAPTAVLGLEDLAGKIPPASSEPVRDVRPLVRAVLGLEEAIARAQPVPLDADALAARKRQLAEQARMLLRDERD